MLMHKLEDNAESMGKDDWFVQYHIQKCTGSSGTVINSLILGTLDCQFNTVTRQHRFFSARILHKLSENCFNRKNAEKQWNYVSEKWRINGDTKIVWKNEVLSPLNWMVPWWNAVICMLLCHCEQYFLLPNAFSTRKALLIRHKLWFLFLAFSKLETRDRLSKRLASVHWNVARDCSFISNFHQKNINKAA